MEPANWAPEHTDALKEYLSQGLTYSEAMRAINAKFSTTYSRSALIGRARRTGLARINEIKASTESPPKPQPFSIRELRKHYAIASRWFVPEFERVECPKLRCVDIDPRHLSLLELERGDCRYPYGGDEEGEPITFCGHPRREKSSYCAAHFDLTRNPAAVPEPTCNAASSRAVEAA